MTLAWTLWKIWQKSSYAFAGLILTAVLLSAGMRASAFGWKSEYYSVAKFGRSIAAVVKDGQHIVSDTHRYLPVIVYYSGQKIPIFRYSDLDKPPGDHSDLLIVIEARRIVKSDIKGEIVLAERRISRKKHSLVLFKPAGENI